MVEEEEVRVALGTVALAVVLTLALVLGLAMRQAHRGTVARAVAEAAEPALLQDVEAVRFTAGSIAVPVEAQGVLERVADAARAEPARRVYIGSTLEPGQDVANAAAAATARAQALAHALEAQGVGRAQLMLTPPQPAAGADDGLGVELRVR